VPLVHTAHTLAKVKNARLAAGDSPEPKSRVIGEEQVVTEADLLIANTADEADELIGLYDADPDRVEVVQPGVDLERFSPGDRQAARRRFGLPDDAGVLLFVGRIQPLKAPDVLVRAAAEIRARDPRLAEKLIVLIVGGNSGTGLDLAALTRSLGLGDIVRFVEPQGGEALADLYRAADLVAVPSHNESFGLVALEAQACGTPVVAASVGGLTTAIRDGISGLLLDTHHPADWAQAIGELLQAPARLARLASGAVRHAQDFSWTHTAEGLLAGYRSALDTHRSRLLEVAGL
jgi:D-inositol-3-phosphate glycosyltransferase